MKVFAGVLNINGLGAQKMKQRRSKNLQVLQLDVTDDSQIQEAYHFIRPQVGEAGLWGLVNNAGIFHCPVDAELQPTVVFKRCLDINYLGAVKMCQAFLPLLRRSKGRIVNISSSSGKSDSKAAREMLNAAKQRVQQRFLKGHTECFTY
ncbi:hypothetical protein LDENG_00283670 [Lucifuga dentata]|nr:hypothetical protein LDENG_00283670 [Lucifuga dentata]